MLVQDEDFTIPPEAEVRCAARDQYLAEQDTAARPHIDTIRTTRINIAVDIALDAVWYGGRRKSEDASIDQEGLIMVCGDIESVADETNA